MSDSDSPRPLRISDHWFPDEVWFREYLTPSIPWSTLDLLTLVPESARGSYGVEMSDYATVDGIRYEPGQLVMVETTEEMKQLLASIPSPRGLIFPWFDRIVPGSLLFPHTRQIDGESYRLRLKNRIAKSFLITAGLVGVAWYFPEFMMLALLGGMIYGLFPLVDSAMAWFRRVENLPVEELNRSVVNGELFRRWVLTKKTLGLKVALGVLVAIFLGQMAVGIEPSILAAALVEKAVVGKGEWWRIITAGLMHGNVIHILFNGMALFSLGRVLSALVSPALLSFVFTLSVVTGSLASMFLRAGDALSVGASGGILGCLGFLLVLSHKFRKELPDGLRSSLIQSTIVLAIFGLLGSQFIDNAAHAGGLAGGALIAILMYPGLRLGAHRESVFVKALGFASLLVLAAGGAKVALELWALRG
ncbi:MAG: rhomboid family intramembrane serine protease [Verrucomicrobiales bacterium]|nr:rhomboid family intramembrane serine protease [Verrucomicrobiales bacterium]